MTAPLVAPIDLSAHEFSIPCQWRGCDQPAVAMCKGCADRAHAAVCSRHLAVVVQRFDAKAGHVVCDNCNRPWLDFTTHYEVVGID